MNTRPSINIFVLDTTIKELKRLGIIKVGK